MKCIAFDRLCDITPPFTPRCRIVLVAKAENASFDCLKCASLPLRCPPSNCFIFQAWGLGEAGKEALAMIAFALQLLADIMTTFAANSNAEACQHSFDVHTSTRFCEEEVS